MLGTMVGAIAKASPQVEPISKSSVAGKVKLPTGAMKITDKAQTKIYEDALRQIAQKSQSEIGEIEVVIWANSSARKELGAALLRAQYIYRPEETQNLEGGKMTAFAAAEKGNNDEAILGIWLEQEGTSLLAWGVTRAAGSPSQTDNEAPASESAGADEPREVDNTARPVAGGSSSTIGGFTLPAGFTRFGEAEQKEAIANNLNAMAAQLGVSGKVAASSVEVVAWQTGGSEARKAFDRLLRQAGFTKNDLKPLKNENGEFLFFTAQGPRGKTFGMWVVSGDQTMLAWGVLR